MKPAIRILLAATATAATALPQGEAEFLRGLDSVEQLNARGSWRSAERQLQTLLQDHAEEDYARLRVERICRDLEACRFHLTHRPPSPERMVKGRLLGYDRRSRKVKIRYDAPHLPEFFEAPKLGAQFHEIIFSGPYKITLSGNRYPTGSAGLRVFVCEDETGIIEAILGYPATRQATGVLSSLRSFTQGGHQELVPPKPSTARPGEPFLATIEVGERTIRASLNGSIVLDARKPRQVFGRCGVTVGGFDRIIVEGIAGPAWMQGKIDAHVQAERESFRATFDPGEHLPAWLFEAAASPDPGAPPTRGTGATTYRPSTRIGTEIARLGGISKLVNANRFEEALAALGGTNEDPAKAYLRALCLSALNRPDEALAACDVACDADPEFAESHGLRARIYAQLRRFDDAVYELLGVLEQHPEHATAHHFLVTLLLQRGRIDDAAAVLQRGREQGVAIPDLATLEEHLNRARRGPSWRRTYAHNSEHFRVQSNVDQRTCVEAARALERALRTYHKELGTRRARGERSRVFVFASESGYHDYCNHVLGGSRRHTAGLYAPSLKQLLIWSLPDYEQMLHTVRHEGLHQYLDTVMDEPPLWFNEGLAMYYEREDPATPRSDLLAVLARSGTRPLGTFLSEDDHAFHHDARQSYAQSWALIHYLRESSPATRAIFDRLFAELQRPVSNERALTNALGGMSLATLEREFEAHLLKLQAAATPIK